MLENNTPPETLSILNYGIEYAAMLERVQLEAIDEKYLLLQSLFVGGSPETTRMGLQTLLYAYMRKLREAQKELDEKYDTKPNI